MTILLNDLIRVANLYKFNGLDDQVNVLHFHVDNASTGSPTDFLADMRDFLLAAYGEIDGFIPTITTHAGASVFSVTGGGPVGDIPAQAALDGDAGADALPPQNAALLVLPTAVSRVQGRIYLPTTVEDYNADGALEASYVTAITAFADMLVAPYTGGNGFIFHYVVTGTAGTHTPTGYKIISHFREQRRRQAGRGS